MTSNLFDLSGQVCLVTAATAGLGLAMAQALAAHGAKVVVTSRSADKLQACVQVLRAEFGDKAAEGCVYDPQAADSQHAGKALIDAVIRGHGRLDAVLINAGTHGAAPLQDWTPAQWQGVLSTNLEASFFLAQQAAVQMKLQGLGNIVFTSSLTGLLGRANIHGYTASKSALLGITRSLAAELAPSNIRVNALVPGYFETDLSSGLRQNEAFMQKMQTRIPLARWGQPQDLQGLAVLLASPASSYITGQGFVVDGGLSAVI